MMRGHACTGYVSEWPTPELLATFERFPAEDRATLVNLLMELSRIAETQGWLAQEARVDLHQKVERALCALEAHPAARAAPNEGPRWFHGVAMWIAQATRDRCTLCAGMRLQPELPTVWRPAPKPTEKPKGPALPPGVLPTGEALQQLRQGLKIARDKAPATPKEPAPGALPTGEALQQLRQGLKIARDKAPATAPAKPKEPELPPGVLPTGEALQQLRQGLKIPRKKAP